MTFLERLITFWEDNPRLELVIFAFALHGILAPFTGLDHDMNIWFQVADDLISGRNPYVVAMNSTEYYAYLPLWAYLLYGIKLISNLFGGNIYFTRYLIKLPMILCQIGTAWIGSRLYSKYRTSKEGEDLIFTILLLNPFFYLIGSVWGTFDILPTFFTILTVYLLVESSEEIHSNYYLLFGGASLALAVLAKLYPIILLPLFLIYLRSELKWTWFIGGFTIILTVICLPFFLMDPNAFLQVIIFHSTRIGGGVTYWNGLWILISQGEMSLATATELSGFYIIPFVIALLITYFWMWKNSNKNSLLIGTTLIIWVFSFSFKLILEQYCVWITTFTILVCIIEGIPENFENSANKNWIWITICIIVILLPIIYLTISIPLPDLFYVDLIRKQSEFINQFSFYEKQIVLFLIGSCFAVIHFILWLNFLLFFDNNPV